MDPNERDDVLLDRLGFCILTGDNEEAQTILHDLDPCSWIDSSGQTLLHVAAKFNNGIITKYLIDAGCKIDATDKNGNTPLILACQQNYTDVIKLLLGANASVLISNDEGKNAAEIILGDRELNLELVKFVDPFLERVKEECSNDSLRTAKELLRIGCSLTRATRLMDTAITKYMLENGCNINDQDRAILRWTPLHQALILQDNENAKLLIDHGADVNVEDADGSGPLSNACDIEMLAILLSKGARVVDDNGILLAPELFSCWPKVVVEMLIERYNLTDLTVKDRNGTTLFHYLVSNQKFDPIEILQRHFDYSLDVNQKDHEGSTVLSKALRAGNVGTVGFLLKRGAKIDASHVWLNKLYYSPASDILRATRKEIDRKNILMLLLQYGADIQWTSTDFAGNELCNLDSVMRGEYFTMTKIILARLALVEDLGVEIKNLYRERIEHNAIYKKYLEFCKQTIEKLKRTVISQRVTMFDFMTCSEETLLKFARSEKFVATVQSIMYHKRNSNLYYYKVLRKRVKKVFEIVDLRKHVSLFVNVVIPELQSNRIVIDKIVEYIIYDILCSMAREPTFKCTSR